MENGLVLVALVAHPPPTQLHTTVKEVSNGPYPSFTQ